MSSRKIPEVIFGATTTQHGSLIWDNVEDLRKYCIEHAGEKLFISIEPDGQLSKKNKMFAYYHKVMLRCAVIGYTYLGNSGIDEVHADYLLRAQFAKDFIKDHKGEWVPIMLDKRRMSFNRLLKYIQDCIIFIENDLQQQVPDSKEYLIMKATKRNFKKVE